ncbi:MAG: methyltransferase domain-containing protein [Pseudomonadales bacterium]|jgi:predicted nicotinamide N-methyase
MPAKPKSKRASAASSAKTSTRSTSTSRTMRRAFGIKILNANHKDIRRLKREGHQAEMHGNKFWNSSFLIMDYLKKHPLRKNSRVLEIGCGWGLLGLYCAKNFNSKVTGIDADGNVLPYLDLHSSVNGLNMKGERKSFQKLTVDYLSNFDVILGADICYWDEMTGILAKLISRAKRAGITQILIADPCRPPFTDLANLCDEKYEDVELVAKFMKRPVKASGEILIVKH